MYVLLLFYVFFFFKQKTAYEMRISDWSSDVCSSDLYIVSQIQDPVSRINGVGELQIFGGRREFGGGDGGEPPVGGRQPGPFAGEIGGGERKIGRASCRGRVGQYV